jgi:hypothetical protein
MTAQSNHATAASKQIGAMISDTLAMISPADDRRAPVHTTLTRGVAVLTRS